MFPVFPSPPDNFGPLGGASGTKALPRTSLRHVNENLKPAYAHIYSLALEREVAKDTVVSVEYSGSRGIRLYSLENLNRPGSGVIFLGDDPSVNTFGRLNRQYTNINSRGNNGFSYYNALNIKARTNNLAKTGLSFAANYTWAHTIDNLSSTFSEGSNNFNLGLLDPFNPALDKGNADFDIRHRFVFSGVWASPFFHDASNRIVKHALGGWSVAPIFTARTGTPYSIFDCTNALQVCPRFIPGGPISTSAQNEPRAVGPNLFNLLTLPPAVSYTNPLLGISDFGPFPANMTRRNELRGPRNWNLDLGIHKDFKVYERVDLQFRGELFNALNHHNFYVVGSTADASLTPFIQAKKGSPFPGVLPDERRNVQFGLKATF